MESWEVPFQASFTFVIVCFPVSKNVKTAEPITIVTPYMIKGGVAALRGLELLPGFKSAPKILVMLRKNKVFLRYLNNLMILGKVRAI